MNDVQTEVLFTTYKPLLFSLAYRMLGSVQDAEDIVQDAYITWSEQEINLVQNAKAYLCKIVTNRCLDLLRSARKQRETYVGPWLPELLLAENKEDPASQYVMKESLSTAYLLLLEQLSETERAVFLLREVLEYDYRFISEMVGKSSPNCRQIFHRAKKAIGNHTTATLSHPKASALTEQFVAAIISGNVSNLLNLLAVDAKLISDGGGKIKAALVPILGADRISRFYMGIMAKTKEDISFKYTNVNGEPGIVLYVEQQVFGVLSLQIKNDLIQTIYWVVNPDKLTHIT
ncbi:RNA polymerase sigma-70 factor [Fictibacillus phosphorivorans]|uniref:RNA polymerase sigma-70 factor n=1 Tax=Fictibacillus phosphorivorans TaxID=1221500 RepID=UPI001293A8A0|nr:RNA polymerase sigma-70 factor [Fictibacillus phosphorivorans]MQR97150.1 RNA polymerase sigma-70 factor [Fictibacillus phosphorivorans]